MPIALGSRAHLDPLCIFYQMITLQAAFYVCLTLIVLTMSTFTQSSMRLVELFRTNDGPIPWELLVAHLATAVVMGGALFPHVVERSKRCIDFCITIYFWHAILSACINGFPFSALWWGMTATSFGVTLAGAMTGCRYRELQDIVLVV